MHRYVIILLCSLFVLAPAGFAQGDEHSWQNLEQLRASQEIRIIDKNMKQYEGGFLSFSEEAISLRVENNEVAIRRETVLRVTNLEKSHRGRNALIGVGVGFVVGLAIGGYAWNEGDGKWDSAGGLVGAVIGGGAGAAGFGIAIPSYQTVYRAQN